MKRSGFRTAAIIALTYLLIAETWDVLSDIFFTNLKIDLDTLLNSLILKDLIFSLLNALLLFLVLQREFSILKKNELALRESEDRYRSIYENSLDGILLTAPDGSILAANPAACKILDRTEEEISRIGRSGLVDASDTRVLNALNRRSEVGYFQSEMNLVRKDGSIFPADVTSSIFNDREGNLRTSMIIRDVTQRKEAEAALRENEARLRLMVEKMPAILWSTDIDGVYTYSEGAGLDQLGVRSDQMIGRKIGGTRPDQDPGAVLSAEKHRLVIEQGISASYDLHWGSQYYHCELEPLRGIDGTITGVIGVALDTTDQVKAYQLLEQRVDERTHEIERRRLVAEGLREIVATLNLNMPLDTILSFIVSQANHLLQASSVGLYLRKEDGTLRAQAASGWDADIQKGVVLQSGQGLVGQAIEQRQMVIATNHARAMDSHEPHLGREMVQPQDEIAIPLIVKGEALGAIRLTYLAPGNYSNEENELALTIVDQTRLAIENAHLRRQAEKLAVINERSRLARDLHDSVAQSIYSMTLMAEAARRMQGSGDYESSHNSLQQLGMTAQQSLKEIRLLVYELRPDILEREGLVGALQQRLDAVEGRAGIETRLYSEGPLDLPFQIEEALYWIAQEALNNTLKHANASRVQVTIQSQPGLVCLEIADNGQGFDMDDLPDSGGMGLTNMRERVDRLNGKIEIQSRKNEGSVVIITFHLDS
jgi:PAS domain S-box-containing protein